jgi:hypothetical protein
MSRFFHTAAAIGAIGSLVACGGSGDSGAAGGTYSASSDSTSDGFIFKGPMGQGSSITVSPLGPDLQVIEDLVVTAEVQDWDGSYQITIPEHQGLVEIAVDGYAFNEAEGGYDTTKPIHLQAYGEVGERTSLQVNLVTDILSLALKEELLAGTPFTEAQATLMDDFFDALPYDDRARPEVQGTDLDPYSEGYEGAWLCGFSSIVAELFLAHGAETADADRPEDPIGAIRDDFADDRMLSERFLEDLL